MALVTKKSMKASLKFIHSYQRTCGLKLPTFVPSHKTAKTFVWSGKSKKLFEEKKWNRRLNENGISY